MDEQQNPQVLNNDMPSVEPVVVNEEAVPVEEARLVLDESALAAVDPGNMEASTLAFTDQVVEKIASIAAASIPGVLCTTNSGFFSNLKGLGGFKGISAEIKGQEVIISTDIILEFGKSAPQVFAELKDRIGRAVTLMTGLKVSAVNSKVVNVMTREEFQQKYPNK